MPPGSCESARESFTILLESWMRKSQFERDFKFSLENTDSEIHQPFFDYPPFCIWLFSDTLTRTAMPDKFFLTHSVV